MTHLMPESWIAIGLLAALAVGVVTELALTVSERRTRRAARVFGRWMRRAAP